VTYYIKSNPTLSSVIVCFHIASLLVLIPLEFPFWVYLIISILLLGSILLSMQRIGAVNFSLPPWLDLHAKCVSQFTWGSDDLWRLRTRDGTEFEVDLLPGSAVYAWIAVLNFKTQCVGFKARKFSVLLTQKQLPPHEFRRLRVRLRSTSGLFPSKETN